MHESRSTYSGSLALENAKVTCGDSYWRMYYWDSSTLLSKVFCLKFLVLHNVIEVPEYQSI